MSNRHASGGRGHVWRRVGIEGITLLELMIALAVLGVILATAVPSYLRYTVQAQQARAIIEIRSLEEVIEAYELWAKAPPLNLAQVTNGPVPLDPWGNPYEYLNYATAGKGAKVRKDKKLKPINSTFDLYSMGPDGLSKATLTAKASRDDIVRASDGAYIGVAADY